MTPRKKEKKSVESRSAESVIISASVYIPRRLFDGHYVIVLLTNDDSVIS